MYNLFQSVYILILSLQGEACFQLIIMLEGGKKSSGQINEVDNLSCKGGAWTHAKTEAGCLGLFNLVSNLSANIFI